MAKTAVEGNLLMVIGDNMGAAGRLFSLCLFYQL